MLFKELKDSFFKFEEQRIKPSTLCSKKSLVVQHISPYFDKLELNLLTADKLNEWRANINSFDVKVSTKNSIISIMLQILKFANKINILSNELFNSLSFMLSSPIKDTSDIDDEIKKDNFITYEQLEQLLEAFNKIKLVNRKEYIFITKILFYTGLRKSEFRGLKVNKIDFEKKCIYVVSQKQDKFISTTDTSLKSKKAKRVIMLDETTLKNIKEWIIERNLTNNDYIVTDCFCNYSIALEKVAKIIGVDRLTPHGLRHSHCSYLIQLYIDNGLVPDFGAIATRLGHNIENTMNIYYHLYPEQQLNLINLINTNKN